MIETLCATAAEQLGTGVRPLQLLSSDRSVVWQVQFGDQWAVLTHRVAAAQALAGDVGWEIDCHVSAAGIGVAPKLLWHSAASGAFLCEWVEAPAPICDEVAALLGAQLARLHALPFEHSVAAPTLIDAARNYLARARCDTAQMQRNQRHLDALTALQQSAAHEPLVLSHRDPGPGNIVGTAAPLLIDWEYAGPATRAFDLAAVIETHALDNRAQNALLRGYESAAGEAQPSNAIDRERATFRALIALWRAALPAIT